MKKITSILILCCSINMLQAQLKKGIKLVSKKAYKEAIVAFEKDLDKTGTQAAVHEQLALLYSNEQYQGQDLKKAYQHVGQSINSYQRLKLEDRKKLQKKGFSKLKVSKLQSNIVAKAHEQSKASNQVVQANHFLDFYTTASNYQVEQMLKHRDLIAFRDALKLNSFAAYREFYTQSKTSCLQLNRELLLKAQKKLLESYITEKGWALYPNFEEKYPDNIYVKDAEIAYEYIKTASKKSLTSYQKFVKAYPYSPFMKFAKDAMFDLIMQQDFLPEYDYFVRAFPYYDKGKQIWKKLYQLYLNEHGLQAVEQFADAYPNYPYKKELKQSVQNINIQLDKPIVEQIKQNNDIVQILRFIAKSPRSPYLEQLEENMYLALQKNPLLRGCTTFLKQYPNSSYQKYVLDLLYQQYSKSGELSSIKQFKINYPNYHNQAQVATDYALAEKGSNLNLAVDYDDQYRQIFEEYIRAAAPKERAFVALQRLIEKEIAAKNWALAIAVVQKFQPYFGVNHPKVASLLQLLKSKELSIKKTILGNGINSNLNEYMPLISVDNEHLYFCRADKRSNGTVDENIYLSTLKNGQWQEAVYIGSLNTHSDNEGALAISADKHHLIIFKGSSGNGDMQITKKTDKGWAKAKDLPSTINSPEWDADAMISSDGKALFFVSERQEVLDLKNDGDLKDFHGSNSPNRDIFLSLKNTAGQWQRAINLGDVINSPFAERSPFLHPDMKTLYFSSDGHGGLGRLDVYKSTRLDDTWTNWSPPINLGKSINTEKNDWGYRVSTDGKTVFFGASNNNLNEDIYQLELPEAFRPKIVSTIAGHLTDRQGRPVAAEIVWEDMQTGAEVGRLQSNPKDGRFFIALPNDKQYSYFVFKEHYFPKSNHIDLRGKTGRIALEEKMELIKIDEMVADGISLPLKNLFFEINQYQIKNYSYLELDRLVELVKKYELHINIGGHTDDAGAQKSNMELSQNRANAVRNYLIEKGCDGAKIKAIGYGETQPVANNKTADGRKKNRRVEVRFDK